MPEKLVIEKTLGNRKPHPVVRGGICTWDMKTNLNTKVDQLTRLALDKLRKDQYPWVGGNRPCGRARQSGGLISEHPGRTQETCPVRTPADETNCRESRPEAEGSLAKLGSQKSPRALGFLQKEPW